MNYFDLLNRKAILGAIPLKIRDKELTSSMKASVLLMKVQYNQILEDLEKRMKTVLEDLKKDYPNFDEQAKEIERKNDIERRFKAYNDYSGEADKRPPAPSKEEMEEAKKIIETQASFNEDKKKIEDAYNEAYVKSLSEEVECKENKFTKEEFESIVDMIDDSEIEINGKKYKGEVFLSMIAELFV